MRDFVLGACFVPFVRLSGIGCTWRTFSVRLVYVLYVVHVLYEVKFLYETRIFHARVWHAGSGTPFAICGYFKLVFRSVPSNFIELIALSSF